MKKRIIAAVFFLVFAVALARPAIASEVDVLVDKLVKKGVLSKSDANEVLKEVRETQETQWQEKDKERAEVIKATKDAIKKDNPTLFAGGIPDWVRKMQLKGDLRLRYEHIQRDVDTNFGKGQKKYVDVDRYRYRLRLGVVTKVTDDVDVGFGFASGTADPRSANQSFQKEFSKGQLNIDYAYARYKPYSWLTLQGGKFENPLWRPSELIWKDDIRPDGAAILFTYDALPNLNLFTNIGAFIIDSQNTTYLSNSTKDHSLHSDDPCMLVFQPGSKYSFTDSIYFKNALSFYGTNNVRHHTFADYSSGTNTLDKTGQYKGTLKNSYNAIVASGEVGYKNPIPYVPFAALFGEYIKNTSSSSSNGGFKDSGPGGSNDTGYLVGVKFGSEKVVKRYDWQFWARYERLEQDAWLDFLTDSDTYSGRTGVKGPKISLTYGLLDNVNAVASYFNTKLINGGSHEENLFQFDLKYNF